ncbi:hypothetical protein OGAPHI_001062 [Ogataea philodendri]|uniref:Cytochrome c oxidase assembly protein COX16, mitochondrial n=1 Tax=Ogataea philodendri TaxID=1378263 RepID=A0A9P8PEI8_9ASCO|nr:uncharacterized protein OGAPHI_001062 [Ogataea philodendri]KAH3670547.1 hypothetical protein OGAPHI_001062 [Ogataea philodendri]
MGTFDNKTFRSKRQQAAYERTFMGKYQSLIKKNSFLYLGLPMMLSVAFGSVILSKFTALRYEQRDEKVKELDEQQAMDLVTKKRKVDIKEEYYKLQGLMDQHENWEPKRVERLPGESDNVW